MDPIWNIINKIEQFGGGGVSGIRIHITRLTGHYFTLFSYQNVTHASLVYSDLVLFRTFSCQNILFCTTNFTPSLFQHLKEKDTFLSCTLCSSCDGFSGGRGLTPAKGTNAAIMVSLAGAWGGGAETALVEFIFGS